MNNETGVGKMGLDSEGHLWKIYQIGDDRWRWKKYKASSQGIKEDEVIKESDMPFDTEKDCEDDSRIHGMDEKYDLILGIGDELRD